MCGIAGILSFNNTVPFQNIELMTKAMRHRGPDDEGFVFFHGKSSKTDVWGSNDTPDSVFKSSYPFSPSKHFSKNVHCNTFLALGHRRLSIIDLSAAGHQPMCTEDGRYWIVYNGEIYNYKEIRKELKKQGEKFISNTDTEVILKAYRSWGADSLVRFNGMWAFAIWDKTKKKLFCSRDRIGIKPFYYYLTNDLFLFASDIKTLISSKLYTPEPDWEGVYHAMSLHCAPRPMTCFKGVRALEQAHWMSVDLKGMTNKNRFWHIPVGEIDYSKSQKQWKDELEQTLQQAVKRRLIADVPVGTFMSGGIDSTTITAMAALVHPGIKAFTLAVENCPLEMNELPQAKATAAILPIEHIFNEIKFSNLTDNLQEKISCYEEPFQGLSPNFIISKLVSKNNITVVLNGIGGDELFCGYGRHRIFRVWNILKKYRKFSTFLPNFNKKIMRLKNTSKLKDFIELYLYVFSIFSESEKKELFGFVKANEYNTSETLKKLYNLNSLKWSDAIESICYMDLLNYIGNHHVYRNDQFSMHFSLESRFPFLDHEVVELACRIPSRFKVNNNITKYILRQVSKKLIHPSSLAMSKKGFSLPLKQLMDTSLQPIIHSKIKALKKRNIFRSDKIDHYLYSFINGKGNATKLWNLVTIELWLESLIEGNLSFHVN